MYSLELGLVREEVFTFTAEDGEEIYILSGQLRKWLIANAKDRIIELTFPVEPMEDIVKRHGIEQHRIDSMNFFEAQEPVIVGLWPTGTHVLIDGAHRRHFWAKQGINVLKGWAVPESVWGEFVYDPTHPFCIRHSNDGSLLPHRKKNNVPTI